MANGYKILNHVDEQERLNEAPTLYEATSGSQYDTHTLSSWEYNETMAEAMGFERKKEDLDFIMNRADFLQLINL